MQKPPTLKPLEFLAVISLYLFKTSKLDCRHHYEENCYEKSQINKLYKIYVLHCTLAVVKFSQDHEQACYFNL